MATEYTGYLGLGKIPPQDLFNIGILNSNADAIDAAMQKAVKGKAAHNLLDNSDFRNPVNQRGATNTTEWAYCIDRWISMTTGVGLAFGASGMTVMGVDASRNPIYQRIANHESILGKAVTLAVKHTGSDKPIILNCTLPSAFASTSWTTYATKTVGNVLIDIFSVNGALGATFSVTNQSSVTFEWAALYVGAYTEDNLPAYVPKGYAAELLECQRYYYRLQGSWRWQAVGICSSATYARTPIRLPVSMRTMPTVTIPDVSLIKVKCGAGSLQIPTAIEWNKASETCDLVEMGATVSGATGGECAGLYFEENGIIEFSADL